MYFKNFIFIVLFLAVFGCGGDPIFQKKHFVFGTMIDIKIYGEDETKANNVTNEIIEEFNRLNMLLHPWEESLINKINLSISKGNPIHIKNKEVISIIEDSKSLQNKTHNLFNPAIGKLVSLWGFHSDTFKNLLPNKTKILDLVKSSPSMMNISINNNILKSSNKDVQIDLGGYAKGYALDRAKKIIKSNNVKNALINIGGNILAIGKHGNRKWVVAIQHPRKPNAIAYMPLDPGWAIGTSGDYQKYFIKNNNRYSHLINPKTGFPSNNSQSATILMPPSINVGVLSDVLSKPLFIAPEDKKIDFAKGLNIEYFLIITKDGSIIISKKLQEKINWFDKTYKKIISSH